jgi:hypothetical protein
MVWTKLSYLSFPQAFTATKVGKKWLGAEVGSRYRSVLKKEFLKAGVPWEYDPVRYQKKEPLNPFEQSPKLPQSVKNKRMRVARIERALAKQDELQLKHRQEVASKKRLTGLDFFMMSSLGNVLRNR